MPLNTTILVEALCLQSSRSAYLLAPAAFEISLETFLKIPTGPRHRVIQHGMKIVCLKCFLGSVNTYGSTGAEAHGRFLHPSHQHLPTQTSPWTWDPALRSSVAVPTFTSIDPDDSDTRVECGHCQGQKWLKRMPAYATKRWFPFRLGRPADARIVASFPGTMVVFMLEADAFYM